MASDNLHALLQQNLDVLFVYIGWAERYDGTEPVNGTFSWLRDHPGTEAGAFYLKDDGYFHCGIGPGALPDNSLHVVFVNTFAKNEVRWPVVV
jgi:hypothetical protein